MKVNYVGKDGHGIHWVVYACWCPECKEIILRAASGAQFDAGNNSLGAIRQQPLVIYPRKPSREPAPPDVPLSYAQVYAAAGEILEISPEASAALSRRLLQDILRSEAKVVPQDLAKEIDEVIARGTLSAQVAESLDAVRNIGNFGAHPIKSQTTGAILPVEPEEAEWNLDALLDVFDYYFVAPAAHKRRKDALNKKLTDAGKPVI